MTTSERIELQQVIEKKIKATELAITDYKEMTQPVAPENSIGRLSRMDAINNKSVMEAALREAESKLIRLRESLQKLDSDDFGLCIQCKEPIPFNRLKAMPDANRCMNCAR
jgi:DnaK suppressor protein